MFIKITVIKHPTSPIPKPRPGPSTCRTVQTRVLRGSCELQQHRATLNCSKLHNFAIPNISTTDEPLLRCNRHIINSFTRPAGEGLTPQEGALADLLAAFQVGGCNLRRYAEAFVHIH